MERLSVNEQKSFLLLMTRYPKLELIKESILNAYLTLRETQRNGRKILVAGNGGSSADADHMVGELMKSFRRERPLNQTLKDKLRSIDAELGNNLAENLQQPITAISLTVQSAVNTAYINDVNADGVYAQQLLGYGREGDVFIGISTSGNSKNIVSAAVTAKALGISTIALTGRSGGYLAELCDISVIVPEQETFVIQEFHLPIYHCWCMMLEDYFFGTDEGNAL